MYRIRRFKLSTTIRDEIASLNKPTSLSRFALPDYVSVVRVCLIPALFWSVDQDRALLSAAFFGIAIASDLLDGYLARRMQIQSSRGTLIDHCCDAIFVVSMTALCAYLGLITWVLPILISLAFIQYVVDSRAHRRQALRASLLGRLNGVAYFAIAGFAILHHHNAANNASIFGVALAIAAWTLCITTLVSMLLRIKQSAN